MPRSPSLDARDAALARLKDSHPHEFAVLYDEERVERGLSRLLDRKRERILQMEEQIARLKAQVGDD